MAKKTKKKVAKRGFFGRKPKPESEAAGEPTEEVAVAEAPPEPKPSKVEVWPAGSPEPDDVQKNDKGQHIIDRGPEGEWVFKLKTNKKFIVKES